MSSGSFRETSLAIDGDGPPSAADFDGDGRDDLLIAGTAAVAATTVSFFDSEGAIERTVRLPAAAAVAVGDVTADAFPDVVVGGSFVSAFGARKSRVFSPLVSALPNLNDSAALLAADVDCDGLRDFLLLEGNQLFRISASGARTKLADLATSAERLRELEDPERNFTAASFRAVGKLDGPLERPCAMLALPSLKDGEIQIYGPNQAGTGAFDRLSSVSYDSSLAPARWLFADMNEDGRDDLLVTSDGANVVSYGVGDGTFHSDRFNLPAPAAGTADGRALPLTSTDEILAAAGLPGQSPVLFPASGFTAGAEYTSARVLEATGDPWLDVAAVSQGLGIGLLRGRENGRFSVLSLPTGGIPTVKDVADLDGDGFQDVLLREDAADGKAPSAVTVLFSPVTTESRGPVKLAEFNRADELVAGDLNEPLAPEDGNADIGVLYSGDDGRKKLGFMAGGADRLLRSPMPTPAKPGLSSTWFPVLGRFRNVAARDLVLVEESESLEDYGGMGEAPNPELTLFSIDRSGAAPIDRTSLALRSFPSFGLGAIDADGDGLDELYVIGTDALLALRRREGSFAATTALPEGSLERLRVLDATGDGRSDVIVIREHDLWVLAAANEKGAGSVHRLSAAGVGCVQLLEYVFLQADSDPELELALRCFRGTELEPVFDDHLTTHDVDLERGTLVRISPLPVSYSGGFVVGDFNGDGVDDLAGSLFVPTVFWGVPRP